MQDVRGRLVPPRAVAVPPYRIAYRSTTISYPLNCVHNLKSTNPGETPQPLKTTANSR